MNRRPGEERHHRPRRRRRGGGGGGGQQAQAQSGSNTQRQEQQQEVKKSPPVLKRYTVLFYDNHAQAREDKERLTEAKSQFDQVNIVIKAEGNMDDPELLAYGKVFAGEAWHLIHKRRVDDGWYNEPHE